MKMLYLSELESFFSSPLFHKAQYLIRENRVYRVELQDRKASAQVLGQEPLPQKVQILFNDEGLHCQCECGKSPCVHLAGIIKKLHLMDRIPAGEIHQLLSPSTPAPVVENDQEEGPQDQLDLFSGMELFSIPSVQQQSYELEFQLYRQEKGHLAIRPANRHILEDGSHGHLRAYQKSKLKDPPSRVQQALMDLINQGEECLTQLLQALVDRSIPLGHGQMGLPLVLEQIEELSIRFVLHSYVPGRGILFRPYLCGKDSHRESAFDSLELEKEGLVVYQEEENRLIYLAHCPKEVGFLRLLKSKSKGLLEQELESMTRLKERLQAQRINLDYSLVDTRIREYPPRMVLQLKNRREQLRIHFIFYYEDSPIAGQDSRDYFPAAEAGCGVIYKRDRQSEAQWLHRASEILEDEISYQRGYYASMVEASGGEDLRLKIELQDFIAYYGRELMTQDIGIELEDRPLRYKGDLNFQLNRQSDWLELKTQEGGEDIFLDDLFESHGLIKVGQGYLVLSKQDVDLIHRLRKQGLDHQGQLETSAANLPLLETMEERLDQEDPLQDRLRDLRELNKEMEEDPQHPPRLEGFQAKLRNYQQHGLHWLRFLHSKGLQGCLADDMGLGKTVQTLALIHHLKGSAQWGPSLLIGPVVTMANWEAEIHKFTPELRYIRHQGAKRAEEMEDLAGYDLIISSYQTVRNDLELFQSMDFYYIILDEAHYIKNASSQTFHAIRSLKSHHRLSLTGTPIENNTLELWSQMSFLNPGLLGSLRDFQYRYAMPIEREGDEGAAELLRQTVYPFILRRTKEEVATDLPPREEILLTLEMTGEQDELYKRMKDFYRSQVKGLLDSQGRQKSSMEIFSYLLKLRQLAIHPPMAGEDYQDTPSCKMDALMDLLDEICLEDHKVLVFSQFLGSLDAIRRHCEGRHWNYSMLTGKTEDREEQIRRFQEEEDTKIFLLSLKAGGVGINLTAADYVVLFDPWWNPAVERQAVDRAYRIGQKRKVFTYRLIAKDSIEEKILRMQEHKKALADQIITEEEGIYKNLTDQDILNLFD